MNSGSSSLKYQLYVRDAEGVLSSVFKGLIERIGEVESDIRDHRDAIRRLVSALNESGRLETSPLAAIGHRVVHGGECFWQAICIDDQVIEGIREASALAPLHNPPNLEGIEACRAHWPDVPQVAVFDTAFHHTLPVCAYRYAIPEMPEGPRIRRYGFHGTSFASIRRQTAQYFGRDPDTLNLIVLHLGNGASACAIRSGKSIDTSMGMTPTAGLVMGTRCGDLDPGVLVHWLREEGLSPDALDRRINKESGLKALSGSNDMRELIQRVDQGDPDAADALDVYIYRLRHYIGAYRAELPRLDALIFTGGIGEHASKVRSLVLANLEHLGFTLDETRNLAPISGICPLHVDGAPVEILVVPTDEELEIARQTDELIGKDGTS